MSDDDYYSDMVNKGLHWVAQYYQVRQRPFSDFIEHLRGSITSALFAPINIFFGFWNTTKKSTAAADTIRQGRLPRVSDVPLVTGIGTNQRFRTQGLVKLLYGGLGQEGKPLEATIPFTRDGPKMSPLVELLYGINEEVKKELDSVIQGSRRDTKERDRARFIQNKGEPIEYDIAPLFVWRTS